ncbi:hypothetical protein HMPREF3225_00637, partial [Staphylococcus lugdunensis]
VRGSNPLWLIVCTFSQESAFFIFIKNFDINYSVHMTVIIMIGIINIMKLKPEEMSWIFLIFLVI